MRRPGLLASRATFCAGSCQACDGRPDGVVIDDHVTRLDLS
jgi:hypothetical protein